MNPNELVHLTDLAEPRVGFLKWIFYKSVLGRDLDVERDVRRIELIFSLMEEQHKRLRAYLFPEEPKTQPWDGYTIT